MSVHKFWDEITGDEIRPGMRIKKPGESDQKAFIVPAYSGECEKGRHFGSGCYDSIGKWLYWHTVTIPDN